ncbi:MAG: hypothetical protein JNL58_32300 [Planctomyces sp.]|nr:hypothetical protein [Planctomyces sp.]
MNGRGEIIKSMNLLPGTMMPWYVWQLDECDDIKYVVLEGQNLTDVPGGASAIIYTFDADANLTSREWLFAGDRMDLRFGSLKYDRNLKVPLLSLTCNSIFDAEKIKRHFYCLGHGKVRLVRIEDGNHVLVPNEYRYERHTVGKRRAIPDLANVLSLLASEDTIDQLDALTFVSGELWDNELAAISEPIGVEQNLLSLKCLRDTPEIQKLLNRRKQSGHPWISEAASLAAARIFRESTALN